MQTDAQQDLEMLELTAFPELFFHTDRSGWDLPPRLLLTTLKVQSHTGGESLLVDGNQVIESIQDHEKSLYELLTDSKHSIFEADDGTFRPRPIYDEKAGIFRFRFDDHVQLSASLIDRFSDLRQLIYEYAHAITLQVGQSYLVDNHRFLYGRTSFTGPRELLRTLAHPHGKHTVKLILFDVGGILCRSEALSIDAFYRCVSDVLGKDITHMNTRVNLHGRTDRSLLQNILRYYKLEETELDAAMQKFFLLHPLYLEESFAKGFESKPCPEVHQFLGRLAAKTRIQNQTRPKALVGLLTGNSQANALLKLKTAGIDTKIFDLNISAFGDQHETRLGLVRDLMNKVELSLRIPLDTADVILVRDTPLDIKCARKAGCGIVEVSTGHYSKDEARGLQA